VTVSSSIADPESSANQPLDLTARADEILRTRPYDELALASTAGNAIAVTRAALLARRRSEVGEADVAELNSWLRTVADAEGVSFAEALDALRPVVTATLHARRRALNSMSGLVGALTPTLAEIDPVPHAALEQARRRAALQTTLLSEGAYTYRALAEGRKTTEAAIRQFVRRARDRHKLFVVPYDGETLVPGFLLESETLEPKMVYTDAISALTDAGEDSWALWAWFVSPSAWLGGDVPADVALRAPERVAAAARRRASNAA